MSKKILDKEGLTEFYNADVEHYNKYKELSIKYKCSPRKPGLSEIVSENIVKFILNKEYINCKNSKTGDLQINNLKYEVKCFIIRKCLAFSDKVRAII